jgi:hypothetical protein
MTLEVDTGHKLLAVKTGYNHTAEIGLMGEGKNPR